MADKKISALPAASTPLAGTEVLPIVQGGATDKVSINDLTAGRTVPATRLSMPTPSHTMYVGYDGATDAMQIATQTEINLQTGTGYGMAVNIDASRNVNVSAGNVVIGTAAKGIDFSANTHAAGMTSELLDWYEEGVFTPGVAFNDLSTGVTYSTQTGAYTRIGRCVYFTVDIVLTNKGSATGNMTVIGLPFTAMGTNSYGISFADWYDFNFGAINPIYGKINPSNTNISLYREAAASYVQPITNAEVLNNTQFRLSGFYFV